MDCCIFAASAGFFQGVIILLAWDQYLERKHHSHANKDKNKETDFGAGLPSRLCFVF